MVIEYMSQTIILSWHTHAISDSKIHGVNMGSTWVLSAPDRPNVGHMSLAIRDIQSMSVSESGPMGGINVDHPLNPIKPQLQEPHLQSHNRMSGLQHTGDTDADSHQS